MAAKGGSMAGMNSMKISGTMDMTDIDRGFVRLNMKMSDTKARTKSFGSDLKRVALQASRLAKRMIKLGMAGAAAMVGIASKAPAVAPALAKMGVAFGKIQRSLGEALAPAFERVAGLLDKMAVWVDSNKEKIGEVAGKFLDWAEAVGEKLWPWLEKIGNWAADNPGLFVGILAGLALGPTILSGIASISTLVGVMGGATVSASLLAAFGYLAVLGGIAYAGYKGATYLVDKLQGYTGMQSGEGIANGGTDGSGQTLVNRIPQKIWSDISGNEAPWEDQLNPNSPAHDKAIKEIKDRGFQGTPGGTMSAAEDRRGWFLQWWDATWG